MDNNNVTFVATPPRTGSTLIYNYLRLMFLKSGVSVLPQAVPQSETEWHGIYNEKAKRDFYSENHYLIKTHALLKNDLKRSRFIVLTRDPMEIFNSYMRFMKCDAKKAIDILMHSTELLLHYRDNFSADTRLFINYNTIIDTPTSVVERMAGFLNLKISQFQINEIVNSLSKEQVLSDIESHHQGVVGDLTSGENVDRAKIVRISKSNWRVIDLNTGFQSGHINVGEQRNYYSELDPLYQRKVDRICESWKEQKLQLLGK